MGRYSYSEFFAKFPELYSSYSTVVAHPEIYEEHLKTLGLVSAGTLLSVGSGEGELEAKIASENSMRVEVVEPNLTYVASWHENLRKIQVPETKTRTYVQSFQSFETAVQYDLVLFIHSWYAIGLNFEILQKALRYVKPGGKLFVSIVSSQHLGEKIFRASEASSGRGITSEDLSAWALDNSAKHKYLETTRSVPSSYLIDANNSLTNLGKDFVAFASFCPWDEIHEKNRINAINLIKAEALNGQITLRNGSLIFEV